MTDSTLRGTAAYQALAAHFEATRDLDMRTLFAADPGRFPALTVEAAGLFLDFSKNRLTRQALDLLCALARERGVEARRDAMFAGEAINVTERRAVLHTALRAPDPAGVSVDGRDVGAEVHAVLARMRDFAGRVRSGAWRGHTGMKITDVVNIGIGGSDLGPKMACRALRPYAAPDIAMHFVSNVDGHDIDACLSRLSPETTLFIVASKTFTTQETMMNADTARQWFLRTGSEAGLARHFVAVSTNTYAVTRFGIDPANMFPFWDWVGGRYSVWSAIGLSLMVAIGAERFDEFLAGARAMDEHFRSVPLERNMPALLALVGVWYRNFFGAASHTIAPYHQDLAYFPAYLQQLDMESNGKRVTLDGVPVGVDTSAVIWGDVGTNGQHAYFQLLHQGTALIPVDFIAALEPTHDMPEHHVALLANCFAQSEALMRGKTVDEVRAEMAAAGVAPNEIERLAAHRTFPGNRPSNTILMHRLTPGTLGALIALYEHRTFVQGAIWGVNSFDQWGVELGKVLAKAIMAELTGRPEPARHDSSTDGLIAMARRYLRPASNT